MVLEVFPKHFDTVTAAQYGHKPEQIGNRVYANRMGNRDEVSGDGYQFRGRGLFQLTGANDYKDCGSALGIDLLRNPGLLAAPRWAAMSAGWEWQRSKLYEYADVSDFRTMTRVLNGGYNGLADRIKRWEKIKVLLGIPPRLDV